MAYHKSDITANIYIFVDRGISSKKCGTIIVKAEELNNCRVRGRTDDWFQTIERIASLASHTLPPLLRVRQESVMMQFCGNKLDKKDFFGKSDPFLVFYRSNEDSTCVGLFFYSALGERGGGGVGGL